MESQIEDAAARRGKKRAAKTAAAPEEDAQRRARRRALELDLLRVRAELERCRNARFRAQLEAALRYLEEQLHKPGN